MDGVCRFDPSCSNYAREAFEHRAFLVALAMTTSRLLRCNPLVRRMTNDPVVRARRAPRPGTVRSLASLMLLVGLVMTFALAATAAADAPTGGCTAQANGRPAAGITFDNPLKVKEHGTVGASGSTPSGKSGANQTSVKVYLIDPLGGITSEERAGNGDSWSSSTVEVDDYIKYGVGTYKVEIVNTGPGWKCTVVGYVQLDGNPLGKPVGIAAAAMVAVGAVGAVAAPRVKPNAQWANGQIDSAKAKRKRDTMDTILEEGDKILDAADAPKPRSDLDAADDMVEIVHPGGLAFCLGCAISMLLVPLRVMPLFGAGGGGAVAIRRTPSGPVAWKERVWRRGRPITGFVSGLVLGLGATVLLWQYNVWLLNIVTAIVVPVAVAVLFGVYAWLGKPYDVVGIRRPPPPPPATSDAPPPPPAI
jgi:hypothetical protein